MKATNFLKTPRLLPQGASLFALVSVLAVFAGCATEPESQVVSTPPPAAAPGTNAVVITQAPPAMPAQEAVVAQPSPGHVWIEG